MQAGLDTTMLRGAAEDAFVVHGMGTRDGQRIVEVVRATLDELGLGHANVSLDIVDEASTYELL